MRLNLNKWQNLLIIAIILIVTILLLIGFLVGYFYGDKSCFENPFTYGIKEINNLNNDNFTCSCSSHSGKIDSFKFDESGIKIISKESDFYKFVKK